MAQPITTFEVDKLSELHIVQNPKINFENQLEELQNGINKTVYQTSFTEEPDLLRINNNLGGYVERYGFIDKAGYARAGLVGIPEKAETNIPIIASTAWFTSTEGHNFHTGLKFLENGVPFIIVGAEGSYRPKWHTVRPPKNGLNLTNSSASLLQFSNFVAKDHPYLLHETDREVIGESRGGMTAMGTIALAPFIGNQNIVMADLTAPCFPRALSMSDLRRFKDQAIAEPKTIAKLAGKIAMNTLVHYPQTIDLHPISLVHQIAIGSALFSGEAGDLGKLIDSDPILHITCFEDDYASMPEEWEKVLETETRNNARITLLEGSHLTIADPETLRYVLARNKALRLLQSKSTNELQLQFGSLELPDKEDVVTGNNVFELAHHIVKSDELLTI